MTSAIVTVPLIKPGYTLRVVFEHGDRLREALWFKYKKNGDFVLFTRVTHARVGHGNRNDVDHNSGAGIIWLSSERKRDHFTIHPSKDGHLTKAVAAVNGPGGVQPIGLDLRTLQEPSPLFQHRLTVPEAYPEAPRGMPCISLGRAYLAGAPELHVWASPIDRDGHAGEWLPPAASGGVELAIAPSKLGERTYLLQIRLVSDPSLPHWPYDSVSFPVFAKPDPTDETVESFQRDSGGQSETSDHGRDQ